MGEVTVANMLAESQTNVWNLLRSDATLLSMTKNILDGVPLGLTKGTGFPYIIVPTPTLSGESYITFNRKQRTIIFNIETFDRKESVLRTVVDRISYLLQTSSPTFKTSYGMMKYISSSTGMSYITDEDNSVIYNYTVSATYEWIAW